MKVSVTLTEVMTYEITKEVEISKEEYKFYLKNGRLPFDAEFDVKDELSSSIDDEHWKACENHYVIEEK